jgi:hypothetical protein
MNLLVKDTERAIDQVTSIAVDRGGYILSAQTATQDGFKSASIKMGAPVAQFENVMRQLRSIPFQVTNETCSGRDVSDEYVDQQSRLMNREATAARVREFLKQANSAEEALKVNAQLSEIEGEIEQVKGRMNYLKDRAANSTLLVNLEPVRPNRGGSRVTVKSHPGRPYARQGRNRALSPSLSFRYSPTRIAVG